MEVPVADFRRDCHFLSFSLSFSVADRIDMAENGETYEGRRSNGSFGQVIDLRSRLP